MKLYAWEVHYNQNDGEYTGCLLITCHNLVQHGENTLIADGICIELDEHILSITKIS